jgi:2'-hydroxyisoflavone reductase
MFNRGKTNPGLFPELQKFSGDRKDPEALKQLEGKKFDAVIDTSGYFPKHVKMSAELLAPNIKQYVFVSSVSVYSDNSRPGADETAEVGTLPDPNIEQMSNEAYGPLKAYCEQAAEAAMPGRATNIRPGLIVGPDDPTDRFTYWPARLDRGGEVLCPGPWNTPIQYIDVRDLADFIIDTIEDGHVGVYNALGPAHEHTMADLIHSCRGATTSDARCIWVDQEFLLEQQVGPWMEMPLWIPPVGDSAGFSRVNNQKAISVGLKFRPLGDTVRDTLAWSKTRPADHRWGAGIAPAKEQRVITAWKAKNGAATKPA